MDPETAAGLDRVGERFGLDGRARDRLAALLQLLARDAHAPSAVTEPAAALDVHLADALVGLEVAPLAAAGTMADLGSGAGIPGLVLAIALPAARVFVIDSQRRKCAFLAGVVEELALENTEVVCGRVEEWRAGSEAIDVVTARALAAQPVVLEYAAPLLVIGGHLVDWRARRDAAEDEAAARAAEALGMVAIEVRPVRPFAAAEHRYLHIYRKEAPTPARYPRRAGVAAKRPLGRR